MGFIRIARIHTNRTAWLTAENAKNADHLQKETKETKETKGRRDFYRRQQREQSQAGENTVSSLPGLRFLRLLLCNPSVPHSCKFVKLVSRTLCSLRSLRFSNRLSFLCLLLCQTAEGLISAVSAASCSISGWPFCQKRQAHSKSFAISNFALERHPNLTLG